MSKLISAGQRRSFSTKWNSKLYTSRKDIYGFENIDELASRYNNALYKKHKSIRSLIVEKTTFI